MAGKPFLFRGVGRRGRKGDPGLGVPETGGSVGDLVALTDDSPRTYGLVPPATGSLPSGGTVGQVVGLVDDSPRTFALVDQAAGGGDTLPSATNGFWLKRVAGAWVGAALTAAEVAETSLIKMMTAAERTKLTDIASNATANATNAQLRDRTTHTGTVAIGSMATDVDATGAAEGDTFRFRSGKFIKEAFPTVGDALTSDSVRQFADVSDTAYAEGEVPMWDSTPGALVPTDLSLSYASLGTDDRLLPAQNPAFFIPECVVNEGDPPPVGFPVNGIINYREVSTAVTPVFIGDDSSLAVTTNTITTTQAVAVGDWVVIAVGASGEATLPSTYAITLSAGAVSGGFSSAAEAHISATAQTNIIIGKCTTTIPLGSVITVTANQSRAQIASQAFKVAGLVSASPVDVTATNTGSSNSTLTGKTVGPSSATTLADELAVMAVTFSSGVGSQVRTVVGAPGAGWTALATATEAESGTARSIVVFYKVLTATAAQTGAFEFTSTDGTTGAWSAVLTTLKVA